jgi:hypothetical protein
MCNSSSLLFGRRGSLLTKAGTRAPYRGVVDQGIRRYRGGAEAFPGRPGAGRSARLPVEVCFVAVMRNSTPDGFLECGRLGSVVMTVPVHSGQR